MSQRVRFDQSKNPFHVEMPPQKGGPRVVGVLRLTPEVFSPQAFQAQKVVQPARAKAGIGKNAVEIGSPYTPGLSYGSVTVADVHTGSLDDFECRQNRFASCRTAHMDLVCRLLPETKIHQRSLYHALGDFWLDHFGYQRYNGYT